MDAFVQQGESLSSAKKEALSQKSRLLHSTLLEFSRTTKELTALEQKLAQMKMEGTPRKSDSPAISPSKSAVAEATPVPPHKLNLSVQFDHAGSATNSNSHSNDHSRSSCSSIHQANVTIALDQSSADLDIQIEAMREELDHLRHKVTLASVQHSNSRDGLQEAWDKLVNLRTHISLFKASIEQVSAEMLVQQQQATSAAPTNTTSTAKIHAAFGHGSGGAGLALREKVRLRETLKGKDGDLAVFVHVMRMANAVRIEMSLILSYPTPYFSRSENGACRTNPQRGPHQAIVLLGTALSHFPSCLVQCRTAR